MPKYYPINEEAARRAKNANSFSDYVPGSATAAYREMVDRAYTLGKQQKGRVDPMYHEKIDGLIDRYARKLAENINQCNLIDARVPSILIAGGSNFPVRKKEKQNAARDKNMGEYMQIEGLLDKVRSTGMGGISADDDRAVASIKRWRAVPSCPPRKSESSSPLWHPTGAKIPYPIRPICLPTTTPTSAAHASALRI